MPANRSPVIREAIITAVMNREHAATITNTGNDRSTPVWSGTSSARGTTTAGRSPLATTPPTDATDESTPSPTQ